MTCKTSIEKLFFFFLFFLISNACFSQDTMIKLNRDTIHAKILEVGISDVKYKRTDNPDGPLFIIAKSEISTIRYMNGGTDSFEEKPDIVPPVVQQPLFTNPEGLSPEGLKIKGQKDANKHYDGYIGAGTGTLVTSLLSPLLGLAPAVACASARPKTQNLHYPDPVLMSNYSYKTGYESRSHKIKQKKVWTNWGIGLGVNILVAFALLNNQK